MTRHSQAFNGPGLVAGTLTSPNVLAHISPKVEKNW